MDKLPSILVIEDDPDLQVVLDDALREGGFDPAIAGSGEEGITLLRIFPLNYRALVTDVVLLGKIDGWRVARAARQADPALPVVYVTGAAGRQWSTLGVPNSILLIKPFATAQLLTALSQLLNMGVAGGILPHAGEK